MKTLSAILTAMSCFFLSSCSGENDTPAIPTSQNPPAKTYKYLALGDSYTIGESVCGTCNFPQQLKSTLESTLVRTTIDLKIIARTGWTTTNLKTAIAAENLENDYDLVTLLIGVNNQYQRKPFSLYEQEFPELLHATIILAKGEKSHVVVVSIPDYAYTPFGQGSASISNEIAQYNTFARNYAEQHNITFVNITDITQWGLEQPDLVAGDGLHPSGLAYSKFVARLMPETFRIFSNKKKRLAKNN